MLNTYNANTVGGAASAAPQAFARTLTGFSLHGPDGQALADNDFGSVTVTGREPLVLDYKISDAAVYSDGKPVTCDDMVLAWAAQSGRFRFQRRQPGRLSRHRRYRMPAGPEDGPGELPAVPAIADYNQLFTATSMMPSHVLADQLGIDITATIQSGDPAPWAASPRRGTPPGISAVTST